MRWRVPRAPTLSPPVRPLVCPYCYADFPARRIRFRCTGLPGPGGRRCEPVEDPALRMHLGRREVLPPVFDADGRRGHAVCAGCRGSTGRQVCPVCHVQLPVRFARIRGRLIALVGAREVGKTVFMTVLVHELMNRVGSRLGASVGGSDDRTRQRFVADHEAPLYERATLLQATRPTGLVREPLVFRFTTRRRAPWGERSPRHTLLSFFDTAGEDLTSQESVAAHLRYLDRADGIVLLVDPLRLAGVRDLLAPGTNLPPPAGPGEDPVHVLERVTEALVLGRAPTRRWVDVPLAVCVTKLDVLREHLDEGSPLRRPQPDAAHVGTADGQDVHAQVQQLLHRWGGGGLDDHVRTHYRRARYFGVSALGTDPGPERRVRGGVRPYRVADPFLWLLGEFGVVPVRR